MLSFLLVLQVMMFVWFVTIVQVAMRVLPGDGAENLRSDGKARKRRKRSCT
jgi:hypothetical protein